MAIEGIANQVLIATSALSLIACLAVLISFVVFSDLFKRYYLRVVFYMAFCDFMVAIGGLLGPNIAGNVDEPRCYIQYMLINYFQVACCLWCASISYNLYVLVVKGKQIEKKYHKALIHIICWGVPFIATFLPLTMTYVGVDDDYGSICYLVGRSYSTIHVTLFWEIFSKYLWVWVAYFGMVSFMVLVLSKIRTTSKSLSEKIKTARNKLRYYPVVMIFQWTLATAQSMMGYALNKGLPIEGFITYRFFLYSGGVLTSVIFFSTNGSVVQNWKKILLGHWDESNRLTSELVLSDSATEKQPQFVTYTKSSPQISIDEKSTKEEQGDCDIRGALSPSTEDDQIAATKSAVGIDAAV